MKCITTPLLTILLATTTLAAPPDFLGAKHVQNPNKVCDKAGVRPLLSMMKTRIH
jgi:hypothetical protein